MKRACLVLCLGLAACPSRYRGKTATTLPRHPADQPLELEATFPVFDYRGLSNALFDIANRRYAGKQRTRDTYQITLVADRSIPYSTLASIMVAAMRCKMPDLGKESAGCALPTDAPALYDPTTMALSSDVLFSSG